MTEPLTPTSLGTGFGAEYLDGSGGFMTLAISHPNYTSTHKFRVIPFSTGSGTPYVGPPAGTVSSVQQEADNLASLIAACYAADTAGAFIALNQVLSDNSGTQPFPMSFTSGATFAAGTDGGVSLPVWTVANIVGKSTQGARWRVSLPGPSNTSITGHNRVSQASMPTSELNLANYLTGQANGPVHAAKSNVVAHDGFTLLAPLFLLAFDNKRLRRHFRVS